MFVVINSWFFSLLCSYFANKLYVMESNGSYFWNQRNLKHVIQQKYLMQLNFFFILQTCVIAHPKLLHTLRNINMPAIILDDEQIAYTNVVKNSGFYFDSNLNWNVQIKETSRKIFYIMHSLKRLNNFLLTDLKRILV